LKCFLRVAINLSCGAADTAFEAELVLLHDSNASFGVRVVLLPFQQALFYMADYSKMSFFVIS